MGKNKKNAENTPTKKQKTVSVPSVAELGELVGGSSFGSAAASRVMDGNVTLAVMKYCSDGSVYNKSIFPADDLYVLSLKSGTQPNVLFWMKKVQELYGASTQDSDNPQPENIDDFSMIYSTMIEFSSSKNVEQDKIDKVGFRKNAVGYYIGTEEEKAVENIKDLIMYLDNVLAWRTTFEDEVFEKILVEPKLMIHVPDDFDLSFDESDAMCCKVEVISGSTGVKV